MPHDNVIVFGASGQDGRYLCDLLRNRGAEPIGVARSSGPWMRGDVRDGAFVDDLIRTANPTHVFHLAANSTTEHGALFENHETISTGTLAILEAVRRHAPTARVFITGSGVQFANVGAPIRETDAFEAASAYAVARIQSVYAARYYRSLGVHAYVGYLFHHDSPLRRGHHVSKLVIEGLRRIQRGETNVLSVADPSVHREWVFAGDVVRGMLALVEQDATFEATIGSGIARPIHDWIRVCANELQLDDRTFSVVTDDDFDPAFRILVSDPGTMRTLNWEVSLSLEELAAMMVHG
jgi:GDPmannose 4,6-dehydratase